MIITTTDEIPGKKIMQTIGLVRGNTARARNVGRDIFAYRSGVAFIFFVCYYSEDF